MLFALQQDFLVFLRPPPSSLTCHQHSSFAFPPSSTPRTFNPADYTSESRTRTMDSEVWDTGANGTNPDGTGRWR